MTDRLYASAATTVDVPRRMITGTLVTYGEPGNTSRGRLRVRPGALRCSDPSAVIGNLEHERGRPVARLVTLTDDGRTLTGSFRVAATTAGDDLLAEAAEGLRTGLSVEVDDLQLEGDEVVAGELTGVGFVTAPAFPSSRVSDVAASEHDTPADSDDPSPEDEDDQDEDDTTQTPADDAADDTPTGEDPMTDTLTAAQAPAGLPAATGPEALSLPDVMGRLTAAHVALSTHGDRAALEAALSAIGTPTVTTLPAQWIGQLWQAAPERRVIPLLQHGDLSALTITSWRWAVSPAVAAWNGEGAAVPSNAATTEAVTVPAKRKAGAHKINREHIDFQDGYLESYYAAMTASYAKVSDDTVAADVVAGATPVTGTADPVGTLMACALAVGAFGSPTYALVASDVFADLAGVKAVDAPAFLDLTLTFDGNAAGSGLRAVVVPSLTAGTVVVGDRRAVTVHELPGVPIRAQAIDMVNGSEDNGVFGYVATVIHDPRCVVKSAVTGSAAAKDIAAELAELRKAAEDEAKAAK